MKIGDRKIGKGFIQPCKEWAKKWDLMEKYLGYKNPRVRDVFNYILSYNNLSIESKQFALEILLDAIFVYKIFNSSLAGKHYWTEVWPGLMIKHHESPTMLKNRWRRTKAPIRKLLELECDKGLVKGKWY